MQSYHLIIEKLQKFLIPLGFDLIHPFQVEWYNKCVNNALHKLPSFRKNCLAVIIGNTKKIWTPFLEFYKKNPIQKDPLNIYTEKYIREAVERISQKSFIKFSHDIKGNKIVAIQTACHVSGLAYYDREVSYLCIHPIYGPWIALRAVIVIDEDGPEEQILLDNPCTKEEIEVMRRLMKKAMEDKDGDLKRFLWDRDAIKIGKEYKYSDEQIDYHYLKDVKILENAINKEF